MPSTRVHRIVPNGDVFAGSWTDTPLWSKIDEVPENLLVADYIYGEAVDFDGGGTFNTCRMDLNNIVFRRALSPKSIRVHVYAQADADFDSNAAEASARLTYNQAIVNQASVLITLDNVARWYSSPIRSTTLTVDQLQNLQLDLVLYNYSSFTTGGGVGSTATRGLVYAAYAEVFEDNPSHMMTTV